MLVDQRTARVLHEAISGKVANPDFVARTHDATRPRGRQVMDTERHMQDRFADWWRARTGMHVPKIPLVDVASRLMGAESPADGCSYSDPLHADMTRFEHAAFDDGGGTRVQQRAEYTDHRRTHTSACASAGNCA